MWASYGIYAADLWQVLSKESSRNGSIPFAAAGPLLSCPERLPVACNSEAGQFHKHDVGRGGSCRGAPHWVLGLCVLAVLACCLAL